MQSWTCYLPYIIPVLFVAGQIFLPDGYWKTLKKLNASPVDKENISTMTEEFQLKELQAIQASILAKVTDDGAYQLNKIQSAITYAIGRHDWYEQQRVSLFNNIVTFSGVVVAALGVYLNVEKQLQPLQFHSVIGIGLIAGLAILVGVIAYNSELDQDRPYRLVSDIRYWYYRYNFKEKPQKLNGRLDYSAIAKTVLEKRKEYFDRLSNNLDLSHSIREDIEQLFILHILQNHKSASLQQLRWIYSYFLVALFAQVMLCLVLLK